MVTLYIDPQWPVAQRWLSAGVLPLLLLGAGCNGSGQAASDDMAFEKGVGRVEFTDVAAQAGITVRNVSGKTNKTYIIEAKGGGACFLDFDTDGDLDAYVINGSSFESFPPGKAPRNRLYRNQGDGTFADVTALAGVGDTSWSMGCAAADYDNDGDLDLYVTNYGPNRCIATKGWHLCGRDRAGRRGG